MHHSFHECLITLAAVCAYKYGVQCKTGFVILLASSTTDAQLEADTAITISFSWVSSPYVSPGNEAIVSLTVKARVITPVPGPITTSVVSFPAPGINIQIGCSNVSGGVTSDWLGDCRMYVDEGPRFGTLYQV